MRCASARGQRQVGGTYKVVVMLERGPLPTDGGVGGTWHKPCWPEAFDSGGSQMTSHATAPVPAMTPARRGVPDGPG